VPGDVAEMLAKAVGVNDRLRRTEGKNRLYRGQNARTGRCRVPIGREGGRAENACSVNWAFVSSMLH
jgi:hypothetical protein